MVVHQPTHSPDALVSRIPFSCNQDFTYMFEEGDADGQFGPRNHLVHGWRVTGAVDVDTLRAALDDLVVRHEMLRTEIVLDGEEQYQEVLPPSPPELTVRDLPVAPEDRDRRAEELTIEIESTTFAIHRQPHVRAVLTRFDENDSFLILQAHHTVTDGWSMRVIMRDLTALYARRKGLGEPLEEPRQYREYTTWQRANLDTPAVGASRKYWREKLRDAQIWALPTDRPVTTGAPKYTSVHRHLVTTDVITSARRLAKATRSTPFMVVLGALELMINQMTGATDIVVPTFTPGRDADRFEDTVGPMFNFLPLRTDIGGCRTFLDVLERTRRTCVESYTHDIPFVQILEEAPELMNPAEDENLAPCVFQIFPFPFALGGELVGDLRYDELRRRLISQPVGCDVPDGVLWTLNLHPDGDLIGHLQFRRNRFDQSSMSAMEGHFSRLLRTAVAAPESPLKLA
ncbi:condensation domain-containing protein [Actinomadura sp. DC4]|uniref:condensation domain-containing protein n=1 Tax=Actinomadura sp. DC4 TaxID=3055069 RepID=UPI0025B24675|nr:condensation domain-containing protein [Actinomadura sp. DC4]MDN3354704.1 condensation domain-containing protein [Actinomadura sp. DC4]